MTELGKEHGNVQELFEQMMKMVDGFEIEPCDDKIDFGRGFTKLKMSQEQKKYVDAFLHSVPAVMDKSSDVFSIKFPDGLPCALNTLDLSEFRRMVRDEHGRFVKSESLDSALIQNIVSDLMKVQMQMFTQILIAVGEHYISQVINVLQKMNSKIDKILEFLYGDKKAELMSEISFVKYAYENYASMMSHDQQRIATIGSLQEARKVAMKDIEFYMSDLESEINSDSDDVESMVDKSFRIKESLELSIQLYAMSSVLEVYYSQNYDTLYMDYIEADVSSYIDKCEKRIIGCFMALNVHIKKHRAIIPGKKIDKEYLTQEVDKVIDLLSRGNKSSIKDSIHSAMHAVLDNKEFYLTSDGGVYLKN